MNSEINEYSITDHGNRIPRSGRRRDKAPQVVSQRKPCSTFRIGTWNVRTLLILGKLEELKEQMKKAELDILGICETRWAGNGDFVTDDDFRMIHSGNEKSGKNGVSIILRGKWRNNVMNTYHVNDRILMIKLHADPIDIYIIMVYFPTSNSDDEEVENMYEQIEDLLNITEDKGNVFIMGDFNAIVGEQQQPTSSSIGKFGFGNQNERGARLLEFCEQLDMIITNTFFEVPNRRRYTWKAPGDIRRFQIDYILVKQKFRNQIKSSHTYPGLEIESDHNVVMAKCNIAFKRRKKCVEKKWCLDKLKCDTHVQSFKEELEKSDNNSWDSLKSNIVKVSDTILGKNVLEPRKPWMKSDILSLIKERNYWKTRDNEKYKQIKNMVTEECRKAKTKWMDENSVEIQQLINKHDNGVYSKIKKLQYTPRTKSNIVKDKEGKVLFDNEKVADRWKEYIEELYFGEEATNQEDYIEKEEHVNENMKGDKITEEEFYEALVYLNDKKATGADGIPAEILKNMDQKTEKSLFDIITECYENGTIPLDFIQSKTITLPKKGNATECKNYRTIALLSHASKILLNIIKNRLRDKVEERLDDDQFGFRRGKGTREAILALRQILEKRIEKDKKTFLAFVDLEKAFDTVDWKLLFKTLHEAEIHWKDRRFILNLYKSQTTIIDVNGTRKEARIRRGVRQGCPLSPYLFNLFIETALNEMKSNTRGITIGRQQIHSIRFADDIALLSESEGDLTLMLNSLDSALNKSKLKINPSKTKSMVISKLDQNIIANIRLKSEIIDQVKEFSYLGSLVTEDNKSTKDIRKRIGMAKQAFEKKKALLSNNNLSVATRKRFIKTYIWSILLYGCETWTMRQYDRDRLEAMEMWIWRRMTKTKWIERKRNETILEEIKESRNLIESIMKRKIKLVGHLLRHNNFIINIIEGKKGVTPDFDRGERVLGLTEVIGP
uniref:Craniofacial development protein 2 n=1 Tax=Cacopsylla melanoneura TaxID=428564 RepID=A0A8D8RMY9_9HEMI